MTLSKVQSTRICGLVSECVASLSAKVDLTRNSRVAKEGPKRAPVSYSEAKPLHSFLILSNIYEKNEPPLIFDTSIVDHGACY